MDIRSTLMTVCRKVTRDFSVDDRARILRCEAMLILGEVFVAQGGSTKAGLGDIKNRLRQHMHPGAGTGAEKADSPSATAGAAEQASNDLN